MRDWDDEFRPGEFARWGDFRLYYDVVAQCKKCSRRTKLSVAWLDRMLRHDEFMVAIEQRLRCSECKKMRAILLVRKKPR